METLQRTEKSPFGKRAARSCRVMCTRIVGVLALAAVTVACGTVVRSGGQACTEMGAPRGIGVDIAPPTAARVETASLTACWNGKCRTWPVELRPSTSATDTTCGDDPGDVCSAKVRKTGGLHGFVDIPDLPAEPVRVNLTLAEADGTEVVDRTLEVTPRRVSPNGPSCPPHVPQARLVVDESGEVHAR